MNARQASAVLSQNKYFEMYFEFCMLKHRRDPQAVFKWEKYQFIAKTLLL